MAMLPRGLATLVDSGGVGVSRVLAATSAAAGALVASLRSRPRWRPAAGTPPRSEPEDADAWNAARLQRTLHAQFDGERVLVVANREPVIHEWREEEIAEVHPASGLVTALEPIVRACSGVWVAHGSGSADRAAADDRGRFEVATGESSYVLRRVWLTEEEERGYYYGFANEALWPLCHLAHAQPLFRRTDWSHYRDVNARFADAVAAEVDSDEPIILVQDYHFALVPRLLRSRFPRATILTFWHIPWPNAERFGICPFQHELLQGLLGSSIVGFQTPLHCRNFLETVDRTLEARIEREDATIVHGGLATAVRAYPISIDWPDRTRESAPAADACSRLVRAELRLAPDAPLIVCVDRLDYTKGFEERLLTFQRLLEAWTEPGRRPALLQVGAPSRGLIERYREFGSRICAHVEGLNERFADGAYRPVTFVNRHCEHGELLRYYRAADLCYVSSLHDGMNLVAKEFVAARDDEDGVLLLSRFAGAARELTEALVVNPYDIDGVADTMAAALRMSRTERRDRMRAMRAHVGTHNIYRWAGRMLTDASQFRRQARLLGRLSLR